jgi:predicted dehydrogenase
LPLKKPLRVAVVGTGERVETYYAPILRALRPELSWVGVWGRRRERVDELARREGVPGFTDLDEMLRAAPADILVLCVHSRANGDLGRKLAATGRALLLETPIANELPLADDIIRLAREKGAPVEVAEQFHRRPAEELKRLLIRRGVFGKIALAANDFVGHKYHGVSLIRSYVGLDRRVARVTALGRSVPVEAFLGPGKPSPEREDWEVGLFEFDNDALGLFMFTSIAYESDLRWLRSTRFFGQKGLGHNEDLAVVPAGSNKREFIRLEKDWHDVDGRRVLRSITARLDPPVVWNNPFADRPIADEEQLATALCLKSLMDAVTDGAPLAYGAEQARHDQAVCRALALSMDRGGKPVVLADEGLS